MPISVQCPGCNSRLKAPDAAAGKTLKCPKCNSTISIPDENKSTPAPEQWYASSPGEGFSLLTATPGTRDDDEFDPPRRKNSRASTDDDFDDDPPQGRPKTSRTLLIGLALGGVLMTLLCGVGGYFLFKDGVQAVRQASEKSKLESMVPYTASDSKFTASFPGGAPDSVEFHTILTCNGTPQMEADAKKGVIDLIAAGVAIEAFSRTDGRRRYAIGILKFPIRLKDKPREVMEGMVKGAQQGVAASGGRERIVFNRTVTVADRPARQLGIAAKTGGAIQVFTILYENNRVYVLIVDGEEMEQDDAMLNAFTGSLQLKPSTSAPPIKPNTTTTPKPTTKEKKGPAEPKG